MASDDRLTPEIISQIWSSYLQTGDMPDFVPAPWYQTKRFRSYYRFLPNNPRCRLCHTPFKGFGGALMRQIFGFAPSRMNPNVCNQCEAFIQRYNGGAEVELTILF